MRGFFATLLVVMLTAGLTTVTQAQEPTNSVACLPMAVATAPQVAGEPLSANEVALTSVTGQEVARVPFEEPSQVIPTSYPERSLVRSLAGSYGVLAASGDGTESGNLLALPDLDAAETLQHNSPNYIVPDGSRYTLINGIISMAAFLIDLETGAVLSISEYFDKPELTIGGAISPGDEWAAFWTGRDILVIDLTDDLLAGTASELLGDGDQLGAPWFSDDGGTLFFTRGADFSRGEIISRELATGTETVIGAENAWFGLQKFPGDMLIVQTPEGLYRIAPDGSGPEVLAEGNLEIRPRMIADSGAHLLVEMHDRNQKGWALVDLSGEGITRLPELDESYLLDPDRQGTWALLVPQPGPNVAVEGASYHLVNLETGEVQIALQQTGDSVYFAMAPNSQDGRYHVIWSTSPALSQLWLVDGERGEAELIADSPGGVVGSLTPDGCYLAVGIFDALGEGRVGTVQVIDLATREVVTGVDDSILLGWARV